MVHADTAADALALRPLPRLYAAVLARLYPGDRLTGRITRSRERDRTEPSGLEVLRDAWNVSAVRHQQLSDQFAQRRRVHEASRRSQRIFPTAEQPPAP